MRLGIPPLSICVSQLVHVMHYGIRNGDVVVIVGVHTQAGFRRVVGTIHFVFESSFAQKHQDEVEDKSSTDLWIESNIFLVFYFNYKSLKNIPGLQESKHSLYLKDEKRLLPPEGSICFKVFSSIISWSITNATIFAIIPKFAMICLWRCSEKNAPSGDAKAAIGSETVK